MKKPINPTLYSKAEFTRKLQQGNGFLKRIMDQEKYRYLGIWMTFEALNNLVKLGEIHCEMSGAGEFNRLVKSVGDRLHSMILYPL